MKHVTVETPAEFDDVIASLKDVSPVFVLFTGAKENGVSWCGDCRLTEPVLDKFFSELSEGVFVEAPVVKAEYKGNPQHPYRTHGKIKLKSIPTLILWGKAGPRGKLEDPNVKDEQLLRELLESSQ